MVSSFVFKNLFGCRSYTSAVTRTSIQVSEMGVELTTSAKRSTPWQKQFFSGPKWQLTIINGQLPFGPRFLGTFERDRIFISLLIFEKKNNLCKKSVEVTSIDGIMILLRLTSPSSPTRHEDVIRLRTSNEKAWCSEWTYKYCILLNKFISPRASLNPSTRISFPTATVETDILTFPIW